MSELANSLSLRRAHPCDQCNKSFSSSHQLAQHSRVHTGEKPYKCSYCDRKFKQLSHVQQHTRLHTGERPYKCSAPNCGRAFIQLSNLQQHMKTHSSMGKIANKVSEKRYFCNHCGRGFKGQGSLITHQNKKHSALLTQMEMLLSKDQRSLVKFNCQVCGKVYLNEGSYTRHIESHQSSSQPTSSASSSATSPTNVQLLSCGICPSVFTNEFGLLSHMEQMRSDPKHFEAQLLLSCAASDKKQNAPNISALASNLSALMANGMSSSDDSQEATFSANMFAQNLLQLNQSSSLDDSSLSPEANNCTNEQCDVSDYSQQQQTTKTNSCKYYSKISEDPI